MTKPRFLPGATKDYEDAFDWYRARSERAAEGFEEAVERALADIVEAPDRWPFWCGKGVMRKRCQEPF